jgi:hypothetical protein
MAASEAAAGAVEDVATAVDAPTPGSGESSEESPTTNETSNVNKDQTISREELTDLVRAIKFAKPEASQRQVYREITQEIPKRFPQFAFLQSTSEEEETSIVQFNDVRKVWKKAIQQQQQRETPSSSSNGNADLAERLKELKVAPHLYTVGDATQDMSTKQLSTSVAHEYVTAFLSQQQLDASTNDNEDQNLQDYVHVFLNVPANMSGNRPHQALINFQQQPSQKQQQPASASAKSNKKKQGRKNKAAAATPTTTSTYTIENNAPFENAIIVKIQMAAPLNELDTVRHPMLLYDQSRKLKTFVHPNQDDPNDDDHDNDDGYMKIAKWIATAGVGGAIGQTGGTKAYFYARLTTVDKKKKTIQEDILSVYIKELAPPQEW